MNLTLEINKEVYVFFIFLSLNPKTLQNQKYLKNICLIKPKSEKAKHQCVYLFKIKMYKL